MQIWASLKILTPKPDLTISEWAEKYRYMLTGPHEHKGKFKSLPLQREIMDVVTDPQYEDISVMGCSQWGKTEIRLNIHGYYTHWRPMPQLGVDPTLDKARKFSLDRLAPMIEDTPVLRSIVTDIGLKKKSGNSILHKRYPGGPYTGAGANSPASLSGDPKAIVVVDDQDRCGMTKEGDSSELAFKRAARFRKRKRIAFSTPTIKGRSNIERRIAKSDKRKRYVQCVHCGHEQVWRFDADVFKFVYERTDAGGYEVTDAWYECEKCHKKINERQRKKMNDGGRWIKTNPKVKRHAGFMDLNALYVEEQTMISIAQNFLDTKDHPDLYQVHLNTVQAKLWEEKVLYGKEITEFAHRLENYEKPNEQMPLVTIAFDRQRNRYEYLIMAWGYREEAWVLDRGVINGDPMRTDTKQKVIDLVMKPIEYQNGFKKMADAIGIDSGDFATDVYPLVRAIRNKGFNNAFAIKGWRGQKGDHIIHKQTNEKKYHIRLIIVNVDRAKEILYQRFEYEKLEQDEKYPEAYIHTNQTCDAQFFDQVFSHVKRQKYIKGILTEIWEKRKSGLADEALDMMLYNLALVKLIAPPDWDRLKKDFDKRMKKYADTPQSERAELGKKKQRKPSGGNWVTQGRDYKV